MKFSKATNYALHTMLMLVEASNVKPIGVKPLAESQNVSPTYLSKILTRLVKAGMIESISGANGGYRLSRKKKTFRFWILSTLLREPPHYSNVILSMAKNA